MDRGFVCHVHDRIPGAVYIGRGTPTRPSGRFYNPYRIGDEHDSLPRGQKLGRIDVIALFTQYLGDRPFLIRQLPGLRGKPLECWCRRKEEPFDAEKNWCHGDILLHYLNTFTDDQLRDMK